MFKPHLAVAVLGAVSLVACAASSGEEEDSGGTSGESAISADAGTCATKDCTYDGAPYPPGTRIDRFTCTTDGTWDEKAEANWNRCAPKGCYYNGELCPFGTKVGPLTCAHDGKWQSSEKTCFYNGTPYSEGTRVGPFVCTDGKWEE